jgi:hypothetical protein
MMRKRVVLVAVLIVGVLVAACSGTSATNSRTTTTGVPLANAQPTPGSVTPSGPVRVGNTWMMTVHSVQAYPHGWNAPRGMPGRWGPGQMGAGEMVVVLDVSAQNLATPAPSTGTAYVGPLCTLRGGWGMGMMGPMMGYGTYGWQMMSLGLYRGPMAYMVPTSTSQFTLMCTDPATGGQSSWNIGF